MGKNVWVGLLVGLMVGMVLGYILAESQSVPPARTMTSVQPAVQRGEELPAGHPPLEGAAATGEQDRILATQVAELRRLLEQKPGDVQLMVALGNLFFDAGRWTESRDWYEQALEIDGNRPNVLTDLAVVMRNLDQYEDALALLDRALALDEGHWQALYNKVIVLHFDLHRHAEANATFARLVELRKIDPGLPDLTSLEAELEAGHQD